MTVDDIFEQAQTLSPDERRQLAEKLWQSAESDATDNSPKTGAEIAAYLRRTPPVELVDDHIEDPVAWVKAQRRKRQSKR